MKKGVAPVVRVTLLLAVITASVITVYHIGAGTAENIPGPDAGEPENFSDSITHQFNNSSPIEWPETPYCAHWTINETTGEGYCIGWFESRQAMREHLLQDLEGKTKTGDAE